MLGKTLDLGCGPSPRSMPGCEPIGIDICVAGVVQESPGKVIPTDLVLSKIPFDADVFDRVFAHDFLEHVPRVLYVPQTFAGSVVTGGGLVRRQPFLELMDEVWRVLKPGGIFESCTPVVTNADVWAGDPTHVNPVSENTFNYFGAAPEVNFEYEKMKRYGFKGRFRIAHKSWRHGSHIYVELEAVK